MAAIFYQIFIFHQTIPVQKLWNFFLFHLKGSFCSGDIQIFVFPSSLPFFPVSHCVRGWSKINLKVCNIINCLNKNLITHFIWYLGKEKRYDIETLAIDRVLNKEHFYRKIMQKCAPKLVPHPFWILINNSKQTMHARNSLKSKIFWKRNIKKH